MDQQIEIRTRESFQQRSYSDQNMTYYFSKFQLFEHNEAIDQFYLYSLFLQKISNQLGKQWRDEANALFHPFFNHRQIFMSLLSIWLHLHPVINRVHEKSQTFSAIPVFNQSYIDQFIKRINSAYIQKRIQSHPIQIVINNTAVKAVCMGFFLTANQIWQQLFKTPQINTNKPSWVLSSVSKTLQQSFKPLMVVTQKINHIFGRKRIKKQQFVDQNEQMGEKMFSQCYMEFMKTIDLQKKIQRKLSDICLEQNNESLDHEEKQKTITKDQFNDQEYPLQKNMLGSMYQYITKFIRKRLPWQVASSFVTNILDIEQKTSDGTKVKVLRPAQDFYEKLLLTWITQIQQSQKTQITYEKYVQNVKFAFGRAWKSKYTVPTKYFYDRLIRHWKQIQQEASGCQNQNRQCLKILIMKIRQSMKEDWQRKIKMEKRNKKLQKN